MNTKQQETYMHRIMSNKENLYKEFNFNTLMLISNNNKIGVAFREQAKNLMGWYLTKTSTK